MNRINQESFAGKGVVGGTRRYSCRLDQSVKGDLRQNQRKTDQGERVPEPPPVVLERAGALNG